MNAPVTVPAGERDRTSFAFPGRNSVNTGDGSYRNRDASVTKREKRTEVAGVTKREKRIEAVRCRSPLLLNRSLAVTSITNTTTCKGGLDDGESELLSPRSLVLEGTEGDENGVGVVVVVGGGLPTNQDGATAAGGGGGAVDDWSSGEEWDAISEVPIDVNNDGSDATSVWSALSTMDDTETEGNKDSSESSMQDKRPRTRAVSSRYMAAAARPLPAAPKHDPSLALGQSRQNIPLPLSRAASVERNRPINKDPISITRVQPLKPGLVPACLPKSGSGSGSTYPSKSGSGSTQGFSRTMGLWARTNSVPCTSSVDVRSLEEGASARAAVALEARKPGSIRKGGSLGLDQDVVANGSRPRTARVSTCGTAANGVQRMGPTMTTTTTTSGCNATGSYRRGVGMSNGGGLTNGGGFRVGGDLSRTNVEGDDDAGQVQLEAAGRVRGRDFKRASMSGPRLAAGALSRSVDLGASSTFFQGNRRNTIQQPRSRSTTRGRVLDSRSFSASMNEASKVTVRAGTSTMTTAAPNHRYTGGRVGRGGGGGRIAVAVKEQERDGESICGGSAVAMPSVSGRSSVEGASDRDKGGASRELNARWNIVGEGSEAMRTESELCDRGVDVRACGGSGRRDEDRVSDGGRDVDGMDLAESMTGEGHRGGGGGPGDGAGGNHEARSDTECVPALVFNPKKNVRTHVTLGGGRSVVGRSRTWDSGAWQREANGGGGSEQDRQGVGVGGGGRGGGEDTREGLVGGKGGLARRISEAPVVNTSRMNGAAVPARTGSSPWRSNSFSGNMSASTASAWALSPGRLASQPAPSGAATVPASPPPSPLLLTTQPPPANSPLSTPPRACSSPGPRPRSAFVEGTKARTAATVANPSQPSSGVSTSSFYQPPSSNMSLQMLARHVRVLHNRWLQWRFMNAKQEALAKAQQNIAETALYSAWAATGELRSSVTLQRIKLQRAKQARKLDGILSAHRSRLEEWLSIKQDHGAAFGGAIEALEAVMRQVPLVNGAKADVESLTSSLAAAAEIMEEVHPSIVRMLPSVESTESLLSQLGDLVARERALLEECGELLSGAALLEIEERSLRVHMLQRAHEEERACKGDGALSLGDTDLMGRCLHMDSFIQII